MADQRPHRPFSYEAQSDVPYQPSPDALEQARRLREAAQTHQQRTGGPSQIPHEEFSFLETPIDDNTQSFSEAPAHVREALEQARNSGGTPRASIVPSMQETILPPHRAETVSPPQSFHDARSTYAPTPQPQQHLDQLTQQYQQPAWSAAGQQPQAQHYTQGAYDHRQQQQEVQHPFQQSTQRSQSSPQYFTQGAYDQVPPSEPHPSTYAQGSPPIQYNQHFQQSSPQQQQPYQIPQAGLPITLSPISPSSPQDSIPTPQTATRVAPPIPPQPAQTRGPVAMKSEEDLKTSHALAQPNPVYAADPKLAPYVPYGAAPATSTPFSPTTVAPQSSPQPDLTTAHMPGQVPHPNMTSASSHDTWSNSLCSCADMSTCCTGLFCPCILYSRTSHRLQQKRKHGDATDMLGHNSCDGNCVLFSLACGFQGVLTALLGWRVRDAYSVRGEGVVGEGCKGCCCCCCALVQSEREVIVREAERKKFGGPGGAYEKVGEMRYVVGGGR